MMLKEDVVLRLSLRKGTNLVGRKGHCGYRRVDDNKNITLPLSSFIQTKANNAQSEIVLNLFPGHNTTPYCVYAGKGHFLLLPYINISFTTRFWEEFVEHVVT